MKRTAAIAVGAVLALGTSPAAAKPKPSPKADTEAQTTCQLVRLIRVNSEYGVGPSQTSFARIAETLDESNTKGAAKLSKRLVDAPTAAAQTFALGKIEKWCLSTLKLRCSAVRCIDGRRV